MDDYETALWGSLVSYSVIAFKGRAGSSFNSDTLNGRGIIQCSKSLVNGPQFLWLYKNKKNKKKSFWATILPPWYRAGDTKVRHKSLCPTLFDRAKTNEVENEKFRKITHWRTDFIAKIIFSEPYYRGLVFIIHLVDNIFKCFKFPLPLNRSSRTNLLVAF